MSALGGIGGCSAAPAPAPAEDDDEEEDAKRTLAREEGVVVGLDVKRARAASEEGAGTRGRLVLVPSARSGARRSRRPARRDMVEVDAVDMFWRWTRRVSAMRSCASVRALPLRPPAISVISFGFPVHQNRRPNTIAAVLSSAHGLHLRHLAAGTGTGWSRITDMRPLGPSSWSPMSSLRTDVGIQHAVGSGRCHVPGSRVTMVALCNVFY